ncbi:hypothetical protein PBOI14_46380 [Pseudomonas sp. Boi14]|nr:hypothetical protein PBOI14_46380 [Pseudomonas sp. Boi14]
MRPSSVIVVGAGIVGAAIAYHLARQGAQVTVLEQDSPGSGVTRHSFAWINPHGEFPAAARALRPRRWQTTAACSTNCRPCRSAGPAR